MGDLVREVVSLGLAVATCAAGCSRRSEDGTAPRGVVNGDHQQYRRSRQISSRMLFKKSENGACTALKMSFKLVPAGCEGKRICRDAARNLACAGCAELPNGCPNFEGARLHVAFTP